MIRYLSRYVTMTAVSDKRIKKIENGSIRYFPHINSILYTRHDIIYPKY